MRNDITSPAIAADFFVGLLYATAAQAIAFQYLEVRTPTGAALAILSLFYLGTDWISRYRVRLQFEPEKPFSQPVNVLKFVLEIATLLFLILALEGYLRTTPHVSAAQQSDGFLPLAPEIAFALFAILSGVWNLLLLYEVPMPGWTLFRSSLNGELDEHPALAKYLARIYAKLEELRQRGAAAHATQDAPHSLRRALDLLKSHFGISAQRSLIVTTGEFLIIHVIVGNFLGGVILLLNHFYLDSAPTLTFVPMNSHGMQIFIWIVLAVMLLAVFICFGFGEGGKGRKTDRAACIVAWIVLPTLYLTLDNLSLVMLLAVEQVVASYLVGAWVERPEPAKDSSITRHLSLEATDPADSSENLGPDL